MSVTVAVAASVLAVPVLVVLSSILTPSGETWTHLVATVLPEYIRNTLWLMLGVGVGVTTIGVATAWLTTMCRFPGRGFFEWALILPLAVPAYVMAYAYTDLLQFTGPVQTWLRGYFAWGPRDYWFPDVRSIGGAMLIFSFVFYPYVYLLARRLLPVVGGDEDDSGRGFQRTAGERDRQIGRASCRERVYVLV